MKRIWAKKQINTEHYYDGLEKGNGPDKKCGIHASKIPRHGKGPHNIEEIHKQRRRIKRRIPD